MEKKHILIISFFFQPFNAIASVRISYLAKFLQDKGYVVHVVTAKRNRNLNLNVGKIENVHYIKWPNADKLLKLSDKYPKCKILWFLSRMANHIAIPSTTKIPEGTIAIWRFFAYQKAKKIIKNNKIDLIYTSSGPVSSAIIGSQLAKKYNLIWLPEFRDLWALNPYNNLTDKQIHKQLKIEKKYINKAKHIITVTNGFKNVLKTIYAQKISIIYNGYINSSPVNNKNKTQKLSITHLGTVYKGKRDPSVLFDAISQLQAENKITSRDLVVRFYGNSNNFIRDLVLQFNINSFVEINNIVSKEKSIEIQNNSNVLLLLQWNNRTDYAIPGKLFEYIGAQKPILAICHPESEIKQIIDNTGTGIVINEVESMKKFLVKAIKEYKTNPKLGFSFNQEEIKKFSRDYQFEKLHKIIKEYIN